MSWDDDSAGDWDDDLEDHFEEEADTIPCPECGAEIHAEAEACPACGYWITDADRDAAWRRDSPFGVFRRISWWVLVLVVVGLLLAVVA